MIRWEDAAMASSFPVYDAQCGNKRARSYSSPSNHSVAGLTSTANGPVRIRPACFTCTHRW